MLSINKPYTMTLSATDYNETANCVLNEQYPPLSRQDWISFDISVLCPPKQTTFIINKPSSDKKYCSDCETHLPEEEISKIACLICLEYKCKAHTGNGTYECDKCGNTNLCNQCYILDSCCENVV
jgi:hypothetical protein